MRAASDVQVRRVYDAPEPDDGYRVLVDRLWPRGIRKDELHVDEWARDVAPSAELRRWYGHDPSRFEEFRRRYRAELDAEPARSAVAELRRRVGRGRLTLLTASREVSISQAAVLADLLGEQS